MAGRQNSKLKLLYIKDILEEYSDENHVMNSSEISEKLESLYGISCERKSLYNDIDILVSYGLDIIKTRTPRNGFFIGSRKFEIAELRLLCDAVQAANFISKAKTKSLVNRIEQFASKYQAETLKAQFYIDNKTKCSNETIYYSIDVIDRAIKNGKKIRCEYVRRNISENFAAENVNREFVLSPYALIWSNDHYYLVANNGKYDNLMNLRIDRIVNAEMLDEKARHFSEVSPYKNSFDTADYTRKTFNMFSGEAQFVELKCDNSLLEEMLDRFGESAVLRRIDSHFFSMRTEVAVNDGLVSWIMQFGDGIKVMKPMVLAKMVKDKACSIAAMYSEG